MDFEIPKFVKGQLVKYKSSYDGTPEWEQRYETSLGIVIEQQGMKVQVEWLTWPDPFPPAKGSKHPWYKLKRVIK